MERDVLRELLTVGSSAAEGVVAHRATKHGVGTGEVVAQVVGIGVPTLVAWIAGVPIKPSVLGAALGSIGSGLYDAIALRPTTFLVWGDSHGNQKTHRQVIAKMAREPGADFAVFLGDAVDTPEDWRRNWDSVVAPLKGRMPVYMLRGNHDDESGYARRSPQGTPQAIRLRVGAVYLIGSPADEVAWVQRHASHVDGPIVLLMHRGPLAFTAEASGTAPAVRSALETLLTKTAVVISGDQHVFGVGAIGETSVVTAGIAGPKHYSCSGVPSDASCDDRVRGYLRVTVGDKVNVKLVEVSDALRVA